MARGWKFLFERRRWTLENYLSDCVTIDQAKQKFAKGGMIPPTDQELIDFGLSLNAPKQPETTNKPNTVNRKRDKAKVTQTISKKTVKKSAQKEVDDEAPEKYDDIIILDS